MNAFRFPKHFHLKTEQSEQAAFLSTKTDRNENGAIASYTNEIRLTA